MYLKEIRVDNKKILLLYNWHGLYFMCVLGTLFDNQGICKIFIKTQLFKTYRSKVLFFFNGIIISNKTQIMKLLIFCLARYFPRTTKLNIEKKFYY